jgi:hypothetical protein
MKHGIGVTLALSAAALFAQGCGKDKAPTTPPTDGSTATPVADPGQKVKCYGVNECSGQGVCGDPAGKWDCAGNNDCRGKGWISVTRAECGEKNGSEEPVAAG